MEYHIKGKELDDNVDYPIDVLAGMTGLGFETIRRLERDGHFTFKTNDKGEETVNGKAFLDWADSMDFHIEIESSHEQ